MRDLELAIRVGMTGNVSQQARRYSNDINRLSNSGRRDMQQLDRSASQARSNIDRTGARLAALAAGAGMAAVVAQVGQLERRMTRLGITSNQTKETINGLKKEIWETATSPDIRVDPTEIITAIEGILEMTGDFEFAKQQIRNIGLTLQATGADAQATGGMFAEFQKSGIKAPEAVAQAIDTLNVQGKEGAFTLAEFSRMGPRLFSAYAAVGRSGQLATREIGAVAQVIRGATGSSEQATTSIEALLRVFSDTKKLKGLYKAGIKVFDVNELKKGHQVLRPINELMRDIVIKTKGKSTKISDLLGDSESLRAFGNIIKEFNQTGDVKSMDHFMQMIGDGTTTLKDSQRAAQDSAAAMTELQAVLRQFSDDALTGPIGWVADQLKSLLNDYREAKGFAGKIADTVSGLFTSSTQGSMKRPEENANSGSGVGDPVAPPPPQETVSISKSGGTRYKPYVPPGQAKANLVPADNNANSGSGVGVPAVPAITKKKVIPGQAKAKIAPADYNANAGFGAGFPVNTAAAPKKVGSLREVSRTLPAPVPAPIKIDTGGVLKITIDDNRTRVSSVKTKDPRMTYNVDSGLSMAGSR